LYGSIEAGWTTYSSNWDISSGEIAFDNPDAFNRRVRRLIPLEARAGRVVRKWTWPKRTRTPLSRNELARFESACARGERAESWASLTSDKYLQIVGRAYDAAFSDMRNLAAREKHSLKADSRHGGLLDLPGQDDRAFRDWYESRAWSGSHPWEIVYSHPHGVLFSPVPEPDGNWRFHLSVDTMGLFLHAVKMAIALGETSTPFLFCGKDSVVSTLRGVDLVEVGPFYDQLSLSELRDVRPEAVDRVEWDPVVEIHPISPVQRDRVSHVMRTGSPAKGNTFWGGYAETERDIVDADGPDPTRESAGRLPGQVPE
jgi:hypothetical protein